jgi:hypothetical protein
MGDRYGASDLESVLGNHGCRPRSPDPIEQVGIGTLTNGASTATMPDWTRDRVAAAQSDKGPHVESVEQPAGE